MGLFKTNKAIAGIASVLAVVSSLFADATLDGAFDDNQNDFGYYWYYYDDNAGVGENDRPQAATPGTPSVIDVESKDSVRHAFGDEGDTHKVKSYTFTTGEANGDKFATTPFTFGSKWKTTWGNATPFIGIGTMLNKDGASVDLSKATHVKFKIRSRVKDLTVRFKIQTYEIDSISNVPGDQLDGDEFGYYGTSVPVTVGEWTNANIEISSLDLPGTWAAEIPFNLERATKLAWEVNGEANDATTVDTLDIDDIVIVGEGYEFIPRDLWTDVKTVGQMPVSNGWLFGNFDKQPSNETALKTYWYAYNDANIGGESSVAEDCAELDPETKLLTLKWADGSGVNDEGRGLKVQYKLGKSVMQGDNKVQGFIGMGANLYDSAKVKYFNADSATYNGIYFQYNTLMDQRYLTLEVSDVNDVGDKDNPDRKDTRGSGVVYYRNFPSTDGEWKAAFIPFDSLVYHDDWSGSKNIPLDKKKLAKIQWKVQGAENSEGIVVLDNIVFADKYESAGSNVISRKALKKAEFKTTVLNSRINVTLTSTLTNGTANLFSSNGSRIAAVPVSKNASFSAKNLPAGMYFVKVNGIDAHGKAVSMQSPVTLVK